MAGRAAAAPDIPKSIGCRPGSAATREAVRNWCWKGTSTCATAVQAWREALTPRSGLASHGSVVFSTERPAFRAVAFSLLSGRCSRGLLR